MLFKLHLGLPRNVRICVLAEGARGEHTALACFFEEIYNNNTACSCVPSGTGMATRNSSSLLILLEFVFFKDV